MHVLGQEIHAAPGVALIVAAGVTLYIASRAAADALVGSRPRAPGLMALGHWLPIAAVALAAMVMRRTEIAVGVVFATSVASLTLAIGAVTFLAPPATPAVARRTWPMILPAAMLVFLAGFHGALTLQHAIFLFIEGIAVCMLWNDRRGLATVVDDASSAPAPPPGRGRFSVLNFSQLILAAALAAIGAWAGVHGADIGSSATRVNYTAIDVASAGLLATTMLGPLLVLPMLGAGVDLAHRGQSWVAVTSQIAVVLLNLCLLLPLVVIEGQYHPLRDAVNSAKTALAPPRPVVVATALTTRPATAPAADEEDGDAATTAPVAEAGVSLPLAVWRVDVVVLIALGMFLLPIALGRWSLTKYEGLGLIGAYIAYLLLAMSLGVRLI
ncbi:MAG TPA: hypothetical protein VLI90_09170 [Tepidisphaeraceae bacterium]|nr:hypothetical protein [Tepidisphaeraceae bacterium]